MPRADGSYTQARILQISAKMTLRKEPNMSRMLIFSNGAAEESENPVSPEGGVRRGYDHKTARFQNARQFTQEALRIEAVLDNFGGIDDIKGVVCRRQRLRIDIAHETFKSLSFELLDSDRRNVDSNDCVASVSKSEAFRPVPQPTSNIRKGGAGTMLRIIRLLKRSNSL